MDIKPTQVVPGAGSTAEVGSGNDPDLLTTTSLNAQEKEKQHDLAAEGAPAINHEGDGDRLEYATGMRLVIIMATLCLSTLLIALDLGIVATAIPAITDEFHALDDVGWYGSAIFLTAGCFSPVMGKVYKYFSTKLVYLGSIGLFLVGSLLGALAPNSIALIIARAIQGWGCAGTLSGSLLMINYVAEPRKRPMLIGLWMGVFMVSTILGPLIGGAFTSNVSWRWCFWINLPIGVPIAVLLLLFLRVPAHIRPAEATWAETIRQLDLPGLTLLLTSIVCFTLALQWGGQSKGWGDGPVVATLVMWVVLLVAFVACEWLQGDYAMIPFRLLRSRIIWSNALYGFCNNIANYQLIFYLPIYLQSIRGQSAITSGVNTLPYVAFFASATALSGDLVGRTRFLMPFELVSGLLATAGAALLYTMDASSPTARYVGAQVLIGFGVGLGNQIPMTTVESFTPPADIATITGVIIMFNSLSGASFITAAQSLFANLLLKTLKDTAPNIDAMQVLNTGATRIRQVFSGEDLATVLRVYMVGIKDVFAFILAGAALSILVAMIVPLTRLPIHRDKSSDSEESQST